MPFERPTIGELVSRAQGDIQTYMGTGTALLRRSVLGVLARVWAGIAHGLYGFIAWIARQILPDTADAEVLDRHARNWGRPRRAPAPAAGTVTFTGEVGAVIAAGTKIRRSDGVEYTVNGGGVVGADGTAILDVAAAAAGAAGNAVAGVSLSLVSPVTGVDSSATVAAGIAAGRDEETDDALRARVVQRMAEPPHGGAQADYETWVREAAEVGQVWIRPLAAGEGSVVIWVRMPDGSLPDAATLAAIQAYVDDRRPVGMSGVFVLAPISRPVDMTILINPSTAEVIAAVEAELTDLFASAEPGTALPVSHITHAISGAPGEFDHLLTVDQAVLQPTAGELLTLGAITWGLL